MTRRTNGAWLLCLLLSLSPALAWDAGGHYRVAEAAVLALPEEVPGFFRWGAETVAHVAIDPDVMKSPDTPQLRDHEYPEHFLDYELVEGAELPELRDALGMTDGNITAHARTLQEAGYVYQCDWPLDDQPIWMRTRGGRILNMPYPIEINDSPTLVMRQHTAVELMDMWIDQFDEMLEQSERGQPLVCPFVLHTFLLGQLRRAMQHILRHRDRIWLTQPGEIAAHIQSLPAGTVPGG